MEKGSVQIYYGAGRGKTNAALGNALRAAGENKSVIIIQFLKGKTDDQIAYMKQLEPEIKVFRFEKSEENYDELPEERQAEARMIAGRSEAMIVIGDKHSSNTQKLYEISKKECANTYYIQTSKDMDYRQIQSINNVGITAGASTPNYIIEEVSKNVRNEL